MTRRYLRVTLSMIILLVLGACANTNGLRDAQQAFSNAAKLENSYKLESFTSHEIQQGMPALQSAAISASYLAAIESLQGIDESALKNNGLLSNAYALKAMTYWRLQKYKDAQSYSKKALDLHNKDVQLKDKSHSNVLGDRDLVMMRVLSALIANDLARKNIQEHKGQDSSENINLIVKSLEGAFVTIGNEKAPLPPGHPMQNYLLVSHLGVFSNYVKACRLIKKENYTATADAQDACVLKYLCQADKSFTLLKNQGSDPKLLESLRKPFTGLEVERGQCGH